MRAAAGRVRAWGGRHPHVAAGLILLGLVAVWMWPLLIGRQLGQNHVLYAWWPWLGDRPAGFDVANRSGEVDAVLSFFPILSVARDQLLSGHLPLWNPHSYGGMVLFGDVQSALLYPITWLGLIFPVAWAWGPMAALKLLTAGVGAYVLGRSLRLGWAGSLVAGIVFMFSGPLVVWLQWPLATEFSLLPWMLLAAGRLARSPDRRGVAAVAAVGLLNLLAGHPETAPLSATATGIYLLVRLAAERRGLRGTWTVFWRWVAGNALGVLSAAVVLVPFGLAYLDSITREEHGVLSAGHVPAWAAIVYALPHLWGNGAPDYVGPPFSYLIVAAYVGVLTLLLAVVAVWRSRRSPAAIALAAMAFVAACVALGIPPVAWVAEHLPPYSSGNNQRIFYVVALALALGAGAGVSSLLRAPLAVRRAVLLVAGAGVLVAAGVGGLALAGHLPENRGLLRSSGLRFGGLLVGALGCLLLLGRWRRRGLSVAVVVVVLLADLAVMRGYNVMLPPDRAYPAEPAAVRAVQERPGVFRVSRMRTSGQQPEVMPPNTPAQYGLDSPAGYDYPQSRTWSDLGYFVLGERGITRELSFLTPLVPSPAALTSLRMVNTRYYFAPPGTRPPDAAFRVIYRGRDGLVFEDTAALPRAYVVGRTLPADDGLALFALSRGDLDPRTTALVPEGTPPVGGPTSSPVPRAARYQRVAPDRVRITLAPGADGWLVVGDNFHRGWSATVDGRPTTIVRTNYALEGMRVRPGDHVVELSLDTGPYWLGLALTLLGLAVMVGLAQPWRSRPGRPRSSDGRAR